MDIGKYPIELYNWSPDVKLSFTFTKLYVKNIN